MHELRDLRFHHVTSDGHSCTFISLQHLDCSPKHKLPSCRALVAHAAVTTFGPSSHPVFQTAFNS